MEPIFWLAALAVFLVIEVATLGLATIWFAGGAIVAFIASLLGANLIVQVILFIIVSLLLLFSIRPYAIRFFNNKRTKTNYEGLIGKEARVTEEINNFKQTGTAVVNGLEWTTRSADDRVIPVEAKVKIEKVSGVKLIVTDKKEDVL